jgi:hypothetical protein
MIQSFLDGSARIIREMLADARKVAGAIEFVVTSTGRLAAVTMRVLDLGGREVHSAMKGDVK